MIDLWRGVAGKPWQSVQEAKQHFRKAFSFLDTDADGRVTMPQFRAGLTRLRYRLSDSAAGKLFDHMQTCGGQAAKGHITFADFASPLLTGSRAREGPRVWLRHSRIVSFDTSRLPLRQVGSHRSDSEGLHHTVPLLAAHGSGRAGTSYTANQCNPKGTGIATLLPASVSEEKYDTRFVLVLLRHAHEKPRPPNQNSPPK